MFKYERYGMFNGIDEETEAFVYQDENLVDCIHSVDYSKVDKMPISRQELDAIALGTQVKEKAAVGAATSKSADISALNYKDSIA